MYPIFVCRTEKNATQWSKDKLKSLLIGLKVEGAGKYQPEKLCSVFLLSQDCIPGQSFCDSVSVFNISYYILFCIVCQRSIFSVVVFKWVNRVLKHFQNCKLVIYGLYWLLAGVAELKEFSTLEGEASANNRKSKLIFFYEWDIKMKWKGMFHCSCS